MRAPTPVGSRLCSHCSAQRSRCVEFVACFIAVQSQHVGQPLGDLFQRVGQVTVAVQRLEQHFQRGAVVVAQPHAHDLRAQVVLQRAGGGAAVLRLHVVALALATAGRCGGRRFADAVEVVALGAVLPVLALGGAEFLGADLGHGLAGVGGVGAVAVVAVAGPVGRLALGRRVEGTGRRIVLGFQKRVLVEHLPHFLVQLQRGQLQQPDRLLQLRRQRQVLRQADLQ